MWLLIAVFFCINPAWAQQPAPGPLPQPAIAGQPDHKAEEPKQHAGPEQGIAEQELPFILKMIEGEHAQDKAKTDSAEAPKEQPEAKSLSLSDKIAAGAAIAAFLQFLALIWTIGVMRKSAQRQLRAYIFHEDNSCTLHWEDLPFIPKEAGDPAAPTTKTRRIVANMVFKNFGQTPSSDCKAWIRVRVFDSESPEFPEPPPDTGERIVMGPGAVRHGIVDEEVSNEDFSAIQGGRKFVFVWGRWDYIDAFGKNRFFEFYDWNREPASDPISRRWYFGASKIPQKAN